MRDDYRTGHAPDTSAVLGFELGIDVEGQEVVEEGVDDVFDDAFGDDRKLDGDVCDTLGNLRQLKSPLLRVQAAEQGRALGPWRVAVAAGVTTVAPMRLATACVLRKDPMRADLNRAMQRPSVRVMASAEM